MPKYRDLQLLSTNFSKRFSCIIKVSRFFFYRIFFSGFKKPEKTYRILQISTVENFPVKSFCCKVSRKWESTIFSKPCYRFLAARVPENHVRLGNFFWYIRRKCGINAYYENFVCCVYVYTHIVCPIALLYAIFKEL